MNGIVQRLAAELAGLTQTNRLLRLHTPLDPDGQSAVLIPERIEGWEAISEGAGYRFEITALSANAHLEIGHLLGEPVLLALLTADSRTERRPWHGHVTAFERLGANQGIARYRLRIEPWLAMLGWRSDSFIFQDQTVIGIIETVFARYLGQGRLAPAWRWELADPAVYPRRSLTTQYGETDLAFVQRWLAAEGLFYGFEHRGDTQAEALGTHTLVIADHNAAFGPAEAMAVRFHRADATETEDTIQQWRIKHRRHSPRLVISSWDYRTCSTREVSAGGGDSRPLPLSAYEALGQYAYPTREHGQRLAGIQHQGWAARETTYHGEGVHRRLAPGLRFTLADHPRQRDDGLCLAVHHRIRNNLSADIHAATERQSGGVDETPPFWPRSPASPQSHGLYDARGDNPNGNNLACGRSPPSPPAAAEDSDFYTNTFTAQPAAVAYRPALFDEAGEPRHPKPVVRGLHSAIVVGPPGAPVETDRDHRIKIQFHWQRGARAHSRLEHPSGADNAPATGTVGTWVRVATPLAGANWGTHFLPRVGQEVTVSFIDGDIDRPLVTGALYNGRGAPDAQHNRISAAVGAATANAPAWFAGHSHPAVLSGIKTQALATSHTGTGGANQLVFDDTPGQGRLLLSTTQYATALALGHLKQQRDNQRLVDRGHGAELTTAAGGAVRAARGLLLTTEPGPRQLSAEGAREGFTEAHRLIQALSGAAEAQQATVTGDPPSQDLPVLNALTETQQSLAATTDRTPAGHTGDTPTPATAIKSTGGGGGEASAWSRPDLLLSATAGIAALASADHILSAGKTLSLSAGDINIATQHAFSAAVGHGIRLFTQGQITNPDKPNPETGLSLHAATGPVTVQATSGQATLAADQSVTLASTGADVDIHTARSVLLTAAGAGLQLQGNHITLTAPGAVTFQAGLHELAGPKDGSAPNVKLPKPGPLKACPKKAGSAAAGGASFIG